MARTLDQLLATLDPEVVAKARAKADIILERLERMSEANLKVSLEKDENGDTVVNLPTELLDELHWEIGDDIDVIAEPGKIRLVNLSLQHRQLDQLADELNTDEGLKRLGDDAYSESQKAANNNTTQ
ncbi:MAG: hypothetical protein MJA28_05785 [Gammaproteobacteria bacterium]|nr:hypothetical protein [Gammaproteobacteria bacterium]